MPEFGETQVKEKFDEVLLHFVPKLIKEVRRDELAGVILTLNERWNYVFKQLKQSQLLGQIESAYVIHPTVGIHLSRKRGHNYQTPL